MPLVSVILSVWNGSAFVGDAIASILHQTLEDFEFIIIDDGSTDRTKEIINKFAGSDNRIVPVFQENTGLTIALNRGLRMAKGQYIARQDADDTSFPNRFEKQLPWLEKGEYDVCCCRSINVQARRPIPRRFWLSLPRQLLLRYMNPHIHGSFLIRKSTIQAIGGYDEKYAYAQDYKLLYELYSRKIPIKYLLEPLYCTGNSPTSIKATHGQEQKRCARQVQKLFQQSKQSSSPSN